MELGPILSAMRRNKVGAVLIAVQMAITLAILCNGLFIIEQRITLSQRPTGTDEANVFVITNQWAGNPPDLAALQQTDLAALRALPGVVDATVSQSFPLSGGGSTDGIGLNPDQKSETALSAVYLVDEHGIDALGVKLIAGRNFNTDEVVELHGFTDRKQAAAAIITRALAEKLFPGQNALGRPIYSLGEKKVIPIVGIVDQLQVPWVGASGWGSKFSEQSMLVPFRFVSTSYHYIVRTKPGQLIGLMQAAQKKLFEVNRGRVLQKTRSLTEARQKAYQDDIGLAIILGVVCAALVAVTAFGIVGLTSYWVAQRRRQIGIRRALGATKNAIVRYFQTENFLIAAAGAAVGIALAVSLNLWMVNAFEMQRLHVGYAVVGAIVVLLLGQVAVLWPAMKAASIPPALATRAV
ncbi:MAG TPA: FtsX-like permease family protein [Steroidobacteraceae bacterium]|jgi:putative ABC transport system permease protein